jgi:bacterioferritin
VLGDLLRTTAWGASMNDGATTRDLVSLLNEALARELQVSVQYMLQHAAEAGRSRAASNAAPHDAQAGFISSHTMCFLPGSRLKKIAITEMRHAEAIAERIVLLGGKPTTQPHLIAMGVTPQEMLQIDRTAEQEAIDLYALIIAAAEKAGDGDTARLFGRILSDERKHYQTFSRLLEQAPGDGPRTPHQTAN